MIQKQSRLHVDVEGGVSSPTECLCFVCWLSRWSHRCRFGTRGLRWFKGDEVFTELCVDFSSLDCWCLSRMSCGWLSQNQEEARLMLDNQVSSFASSQDFFCDELPPRSKPETFIIYIWKSFTTPAFVLTRRAWLDNWRDFRMGWTMCSANFSLSFPSQWASPE